MLDLAPALSGDKTAAEGLKAAIDDLNGALSNQEAQADYLDSLANLRDAFKQNGDSLDILDDKGRANVRAFDAAIQSAQEYAETQAQITGSVPAAVAGYEKSIDALFATAAQVGVTSGQLDVMRQSVINVPSIKQILTQLIGKDSTVAGLGQVKAALDALRDKTIRVTVLQNTALGAIAGTGGTPGANVPPQLVPHRAAGGSVFGPGTATSDSIPALLSNREFVEQAAAVNKFGVPFMSAVNKGDATSAMRLLAEKGYTVHPPASPTTHNKTVNQYVNVAGWEHREVDRFLAMQAGVS